MDTGQPLALAKKPSDEATKRPLLMVKPSTQNGQEKNQKGTDQMDTKTKPKRHRKRRNRNKNKKLNEVEEQDNVNSNVRNINKAGSDMGKEILKLVNGQSITTTKDLKTNSVQSSANSATSVAISSKPPKSNKDSSKDSLNQPTTSKLSSSVKDTVPITTKSNPISIPTTSSTTKMISKSLPATTVKPGTENGPKEILSKNNLKPTKELPNSSNNKTSELELGLKQATERISRDYIFELKKPSKNFPRAKFFCELCNYHLDTIPLAHKHIKEKRHRKLIKEKQQDDMLSKLPKPSVAALNALQHLLVDKVLKTNVMDNDDQEICDTIVKKLADIVKTGMPGCTIHLYGSSLSGFGFKDSDINVDIRFPGNMKAPNVLLKVLEILKKSDSFTEVTADFRAKVPMITFRETSQKDKTSKLICLSAGNDFAHLTSKMLLFYSKLDPKVKQLSMVMRKFARMCRLDRQHEGSLPAHSFVIMTIFFMQRFKYLPVLHELILEHDMYKILNTSMECSQISTKGGDIWYTPTPPPSTTPEDKESKDSTDLEDTQELSDSESDPDIVLEPSEPKKEEVKVDDPLEPINLSILCKANKTSLAKMWTEILKFYAVDYHMEDLVISIVTSKKLTRDDKNWSRKRIAMIDPYINKRNLCRSLNSQAVFSYLLSRLKALLIYFHSIPCKNNTKKINDNQKTKSSNNKSKKVEDKNFADSIMEDLINGVLKMGQESSVEEQNSKHENDEIHHDKSSLESKVNGRIEVDNTASLIEEQEIVYEFSKEVITNGNLPTIVCGLCKQEGHLRTKCPDEIQKIHLQELPPFTKELAQSLSRVCCDIFDYYNPSEQEVINRNSICTYIMKYLQDKFNNRTRMKLFGSSRNGFGFRGSDLDICMTYDEDETGEDLDFVNIIEHVAKCLRQNRDFWNILPITTAKVPIVKFQHKESGLEGDISLYNVLAQQNTSMLQAYSQIDERCKILGYAMKAFVKRCCIGDASRGSLSSYAYTLMAIFFLQQRDPPVLPVLQELYDGDEKPEKIVDGWNTWFLEDADELEKIWTCKNKESVGDLWHGLLRFYTEDFDFCTHVICIRQKQPLTTFEKEWTSKFISIEDPFDLSHNLGAGVSRKMTNFILKVFIKARQHFGIFPSEQLHNEVQYFFDPYILMCGEEAPNDRCCRICGKIGHFVRDCPRNKRRRRNDDDADGPNMGEMRCFSCGKRGHMKKNCPEMKNQNNMQHNHNGRYLNHQNNASPQNNNFVRPGSLPRTPYNNKHENEQYNSPNRPYERKNSGNGHFSKEQPKAQRKLKVGNEAPSPRSGNNLNRPNGMFQQNNNMQRMQNTQVDRNGGIRQYNRRGPTISSPLRIPFNDPQRHNFEQHRYQDHHANQHRGSTSPMTGVMSTFFGTPPSRLTHNPRNPPHNYPRGPISGSPRSPHFIGQPPSPGYFLPPTPEHQFQMSPMRGYSPRYPNGNPS